MAISLLLKTSSIDVRPTLKSTLIYSGTQILCSYSYNGSAQFGKSFTFDPSTGQYTLIDTTFIHYLSTLTYPYFLETFYSGEVSGYVLHKIRGFTNYNGNPPVFDITVDVYIGR